MGFHAQHGHLVTTEPAAAPDTSQKRSVLIVGGGPAGLFAAERLATGGCAVTVVERMPTVARKLLMAGRGGLNLTHSEGLKTFLTRYGDQAAPIVGAIHRFRPNELIAWAEALGQPTFVGTSGRVFPKAMKASPLLRAWLKRLAHLGVTIVTGERWVGWDEHGNARFEDRDGKCRARTADALLLALGGVSWPRLGSDGSWTQILAERGIELTPWQPANAGVRIAWSPLMREKFAGVPLKRLSVTVDGTAQQGEAVVTRDGLEGGVIYALGPALRRALADAGQPASMSLDLKPGMSLAELEKALARPRGKQSLSNHLRKVVGMPPVMVALLHESFGKSLPSDPKGLAKAIKAVRLPVTGSAGIERAISSAGGVALEEIDAHFMLKKIPGVFVTGEMLDWEAPTGGYLLQACFATGKSAADGIAAWLRTMDARTEPVVAANVVSE